MTESHFPTRSTIDDELLSAYIDGQVTAAERQRVEQALVTDASLRERYETLRMTVDLMKNAPSVRLPRAFVLSEAQVLAAGGKVQGAKRPGFFERLFPRMAPLATAAVAVLLLLLVGVDLLSGPDGGLMAPQPAAQEMEMAAAPPREEPTLIEMPAEPAVAKAVEVTVAVGKEVARTALVEELAKREMEADSAAAKPAANRAAGGVETPRQVVISPEAPLAAAPEAMPEAMAADENEMALEAAGAPADTLTTESNTQPPSAAQTTSPKQKGMIWLRPAEFALALLLIILIAGMLFLRKRRHTAAS